MTGQPKTALERIPTDEQGKKAFEKAESPKAAYDALLEMSKGDSEIAASAVSFKLAEKEKAVKDLGKAKITPASNSMEDIIAAQQERKALIAQAQSEVEFWKGVLAAKDAPVVEQAVEEVKANETEVVEEAVEETKNKFPYYTGSISSLIKASKESGSKLLKAIVAKLSDRLKKDLHNLGIDLTDNYKHVIDNSAINHALKRHGKGNAKR